jgi:hypothetical protein
MGAILLAAMVIVQTPVVKLVPLQTVHGACGADHHFEACTVFVSYHLNTQCSAGKAEATITFQPVILLHDLHALSHEQHHIEDMRDFAAAYVTDIEQMRFETESQCRSKLDLATTSFATTMREFAKRSMQHLR